LVFGIRLEQQALFAADSHAHAAQLVATVPHAIGEIHIFRLHCSKPRSAASVLSPALVGCSNRLPFLSSNQLPWLGW